MRYAEVAVDAPLGPERTLSYAVPPEMALAPGQVATVPLGPRLVQGVVFELAPQPQVEPVKDVAEAWDPAPLLSLTALALARWISRYYLCSLFDAASLFLPPGFRTRAHAILHRTSTAAPDEATLPEAAPTILRRLVDGTVAERDALDGLGREGQRALGWLLARGHVRRSWELPRPRLAPRYAQYLVKPSVARGQAASLTPRQAALMDALALPREGGGSDRGQARADSPLELSAARREHGDAAIRALLKKGCLGVEWVRVEARPPLPPSLPGEVPPSRLTPHQRDALAAIQQGLEGRGPRSFLLYGVTGSGKTEVYLQALARCIASGRRGIVLVPEISMTPQVIHRLTERFPERVAVLHSRLTPRQQSDQWWRIREGLYDVVVGPRSALFAPLPDLGLVVVDEEHEWTYKQADQSPRYHARDVALRLAELAGAVVVLGSATPDVVTYYDAQRGAHRLLTLPDRIAATVGGPPTPVAEVQVVDMRRELREGNRSMFSRALSSALVEEVGRGQQAILFLNRRGEATSVLCRDCGYLARCRRCDVPLTYHSGGYLLCHQCNAQSRPPVACPQCRSPRIRYLGLGTQRVVEELERLLPGEQVLRWDRDAARPGSAHQAALAPPREGGGSDPRLRGGGLERFARGEARILVGTQMVAKGLHVPAVTLVGVVLADVGLHLPDPLVGERLFQVLCQVAGRAGRGAERGRAIIQTYAPGHYAVQAAARQDYPAFYRQELEYRRQLRNPPFARLAHLVFSHTNAALCQREAERLARALGQRITAEGIAGVELVGPAPAYPARLRGRYRWHIVVRGQEPRSLLEGVELPQGWTWDIDPVSVL